MARYDKDHHDTTHEAILAAASELVRAHGFDGASVATVMKAVGLTHGGFYAHFPDKTALMTAAMARALRPTIERFEGFVAQAQDDAAGVARTYLSDYHMSHPAKGCAVAALVSEVPRQPLPVREAFADGAVQSAEILAQVFPGNNGAAPDRAWGVFAMMSGALALMRAVPDTGDYATLRAEIRDRVMTDLRKLAS